MRYFVIAPDGSKYGPADLATLQSWVSQGRIAPTTVLEVESTGERVNARNLLSFGEVPAFMPPTAGTGRIEMPRGTDTGNGDLIWSYICSAMSIICCGFFIIGGFVYANRALAKGNRGGLTARWVAVFFLIVWIVSTIIEIMFFKQLSGMFGGYMGISGGGLGE